MRRAQWQCTPKQTHSKNSCLQLQLHHKPLVAQHGEVNKLAEGLEHRQQRCGGSPRRRGCSALSSVHGCVISEFSAAVLLNAALLFDARPTHSSRSNESRMVMTGLGRIPAHRPGEPFNTRVTTIVPGAWHARHTKGWHARDSTRLPLITITLRWGADDCLAFIRAEKPPEVSPNARLSISQNLAGRSKNATGERNHGPCEACTSVRICRVLDSTGARCCSPHRVRHTTARPTMQHVTSEGERKFTADGIAAGVRLDGRPRLEYR